jgi:hypothetical protein
MKLNSLEVVAASIEQTGTDIGSSVLGLLSRCTSSYASTAPRLTYGHTSPR